MPTRCIVPVGASRGARGPANGYPRWMRIATWNVNSLKARQDAVEAWLARAAPDILLMQETKLTDADAPVMAFGMAGYQLVHHGEGRWNGVAIAARAGLDVSDVVTNFGDGPGARFRAGRGRGRGDRRGRLRPVRRGADDRRDRGRAAGREPVRAERPGRRFAVLRRQAGLVRAARALDPRDDVARRRGRAGRRPQRRADRRRRVGRRRGPRRDPRLGTRAGGLPGPARHRACPTRIAPGTTSRAASRGGTTGPACSTRTSGCGSTTSWCHRSVAARVVDAEIDREARKGPPIPSDHAPLLIDLDEPGRPIDPDWEGALARIKARTKPPRR